jgi:NAD-dependent dihydropyrimidine dehydrogenase PreA subunit
MNTVTFIITYIIETLLRVVPISCKTGLKKIGNPDKNSPVFLTCNYHLTVERVKRALKGLDAYLLVANSRGINVWCAATGGHLTNHDVISVLKTSGIEDRVKHRNVILPQLAATGIETTVLQQKTGWKIIWGPVYAQDIPAFAKHNFQKIPGMRDVKFPLMQRIEMAAMWSFPFSVIAILILIPLWREIIIPFAILIWTLPLLIFLLFPLYSKWLNPKKMGIKHSKYTIIFNIGRISLIIWGIFIICLLFYSISIDNFSFKFTFRWSFIAFIILCVVSIDLMGSTPIFKSTLHQDRFLHIELDKEKCKGAALCEQVCPRNCYKVDREKHFASIPRANRCVQCGACIVQCPFDALYFVNIESGDKITPMTIRKFKLNLIGKRLIKV